MTQSIQPISQIATSLLYQSPVLLVYLAGVIVGLGFIGRWTIAAGMCVAGCAWSLSLAIVLTLVTSWMTQQMRSNAWTFQHYSDVSQVVSILGSIGRAMGIGLIITGVFVGRPPRTPQPPPPMPPRW